MGFGPDRYLFILFLNFSGSVEYEVRSFYIFVIDRDKVSYLTFHGFVLRLSIFTCNWIIKDIFTYKHKKVFDLCLIVINGF